ncbi:MAG: periplasmic heavy metal sensor [Deltaproteobacteria bacterium]|nr:periplasmic heavy metal sensor [Deltaproteobacteria bacterium]
MRNESWLRLMSSLVLVGVFAAGALFGAGLTRWMAPHEQHDRPPPPPGGPIEAMTHELDLDAQQRDQLHAIAQAHEADLAAIMHETQPRIRGVLDAIETEMTPHLRPDQLKKLDAWRARRPPPPMPGLGPPPPGAPPPGPPAGGPP